MQIEFEPRRYAEVVCDLMAYPVFEDQCNDALSCKALDRLTDGLATSVLFSGEFKPELHRTCLIHRPARMKAQRILFVGAGKERDFSLARLREVSAVTARVARHARCKSAALLMRGNFVLKDSARVSADGALHGNYEPDIYKTREIETRNVDRFLLLHEKKGPRRDAEEGIRRGIIIGNAVNLARTLGNEPANVLTPGQFAERALAACNRTGIDVQIMNRNEMEKLGMNALLAVARGSEQPPKLMVLRLKSPKLRKGARLFALVGKGVTFDSGGISIKPSDKMEEMKSDMAGGAAVLASMIALAGLGSRYPVIGLIPAVENLPSGKATKPGDIVTSYLGKTIEIINTDAEGRLILADAMAYARTLGATRIIDIATLTGACVIALGHINAGMMGTDEDIIERLQKGSRVTGERFWRLPLDNEYRNVIRSEIADIKNIGNRWGGAITAGKFLEEFVENTPWVHLDIAGVDLEHDGKPYAARGATGFGVRSLVHMLT